MPLHKTKVSRNYNRKIELTSKELWPSAIGALEIISSDILPNDSILKEKIKTLKRMHSNGNIYSCIGAIDTMIVLFTSASYILNLGAFSHTDKLYDYTIDLRMFRDVLEKEHKQSKIDDRIKVIEEDKRLASRKRLPNGPNDVMIADDLFRIVTEPSNKSKQSNQ